MLSGSPGRRTGGGGGGGGGGALQNQPGGRGVAFWWFLGGVGFLFQPSAGAGWDASFCAGRRLEILNWQKECRARLEAGGGGRVPGQCGLGGGILRGVFSRGFPLSRGLVSAGGGAGAAIVRAVAVGRGGGTGVGGVVWGGGAACQRVLRGCTRWPGAGGGGEGGWGRVGGAGVGPRPTSTGVGRAR